MRLQFFDKPPRVHIEDRLKNMVTLNIEEAEDLYFGLGFFIRDLKKLAEEAEE